MRNSFKKKILIKFHTILCGHWTLNIFSRETFILTTTMVLQNIYACRERVVSRIKFRFASSTCKTILRSFGAFNSWRKLQPNKEGSEYLKENVFTICPRISWWVIKTTETHDRWTFHRRLRLVSNLLKCQFHMILPVEL